MTKLNKLRKRKRKIEENRKRREREEYLDSLPKDTHLWNDKNFRKFNNLPEFETMAER